MYSSLITYVAISDVGKILVVDLYFTSSTQNPNKRKHRKADFPSQAVSRFEALIDSVTSESADDKTAC